MTKTLFVLTALGMIGVSVGILMRKRRNTEGKELALLADAHVVEHQARALFADAWQYLVLHEAQVPPGIGPTDWGRRILAVKIAIGEARGARMAMEYGEDMNMANHRLHRSKRALTIATEMAERAEAAAEDQRRETRLDRRN